MGKTRTGTFHRPSVNFRLFRPGSRRYKGAMENPIVTLIEYMLDLYWYVVFAAVIVSWLLVFNVINQHNNIVRTILRVLMTLTEPVFRQIRRVIPPIGGLDFSP